MFLINERRDVENVILVDNINAFKSFEGRVRIHLYENGTDPMDGYVLYGFDEVGMFDGEFKNPAYALCTVD